MTAICQPGMLVFVADVVERGSCARNERVGNCSSAGHGKADAAAGAAMKRWNMKATGGDCDDMLKCCELFVVR